MVLISNKFVLHLSKANEFLVFSVNIEIMGSIIERNLSCLDDKCNSRLEWMCAKWYEEIDYQK